MASLAQLLLDKPVVHRTHLGHICTGTSQPLLPESSGSSTKTVEICCQLCGTNRGVKLMNDKGL